MTVRCARPGCGAEIQWALTENGRPIPLDVGNNPKGNLIGKHYVGSKLVVRRVEPGDPAARMPHHATCKNPPERRRTK